MPCHPQTRLAGNTWQIRTCLKTSITAASISSAHFKLMLGLIKSKQRNVAQTQNASCRPYPDIVRLRSPPLSRQSGGDDRDRHYALLDRGGRRRLVLLWGSSGWSQRLRSREERLRSIGRARSHRSHLLKAKGQCCTTKGRCSTTGPIDRDTKRRQRCSASIRMVLEIVSQSIPDHMLGEEIGCGGSPWRFLDIKAIGGTDGASLSPSPCRIGSKASQKWGCPDGLATKIARL